MALQDSEIEQLVNLLQNIETGQDLPETVFFEFARLQCLPVIELVPLRRTAQGTEVLLIGRPATDPFFADQVHNPGTIVRAKDKTIDGALQRLISHELPGTVLGELVYVTTQLHQSKRGNEWATVFRVEVNDNNGVGKWYPANNLPANLVESQYEFIQLAITQFENTAK